MLKIEGVSKQYRGECTVSAVQGIDFELERGRFLAIVGRSGSGKSTLLGMLGGISKPTTGRIIIDGVDQWLLGDDKRADFRNSKIGFVFQFASLIPTLRAIDNVALPALVGGVLEYHEAYARARALLKRVGLAGRCDAFPNQLSGGEQRRVAIARALINSPALLLADEPTADLDEETEEEILNLLVDIHRTYSLTLVVVTHNQAISDRADRLLRMRDGTASEAKIRHCSASPLGSSTGTESQEIVREIFEISKESTIKEKVRLGEGIERFLGKVVMFVMPCVFMVWAINFVVDRYESAVMAQKAAKRQMLEDLAMKDLRADVQSVTALPNNKYMVSVYLRNVTGEKPIYVLSPTVRAFVQVGTNWQEVSLAPLDTAAAQVLKVTGKQTYRYIMESNVKDFAQLIPYYIHVRLSNDMLISPSSEPKDDLIERNDNYYVYLKPHDADDAAILSKLKFPGKPPVWIPMPPH
ncbi:MAG TPA: ABC transporter ATP-binding protein [Candidatus Obscuribacterales bacterium]